ncbi:MAG TPA: succinylglutamate desuccinylase/aspartoacylase family protein [Gaiellaceae bacterium]
MSHPVISTIDLTAPGRQVGRLEIPKSTNTGGWGHQFIPIATVANGEGPTVLVLGGNHGDEYEGQVAGLRLLRDLQPDQVTGRVIVIPCLSPEASVAGTRMWPSGINFNRSFPGRPDGAAHDQLADYLTTVLFPLSDVVIDMHSGGSTAHFVPCSHMHVVDDAEQRGRMLDGMLAWGSEYNYLYIDIAGHGLLPVEAENQGKTVITTELGGGGYVKASTHRLAQDGLANVLRHVGVLKGEAQSRVGLGLPEAIILDGRDPANYIFSPTTGIFETLVDVGETVEAGQLVGVIHSLEYPEREPEPIVAALGGVTAAVRAISWTDQGDNVLVFGQPIEAAALR